MKKRLHSLKTERVALWAVILLLPLSCVKEIQEQQPNTTESNKIVFTGVDINSATKTTLNGLQVSWIANIDKIGIFSPQASPTTVGGGEGVFNVELTAVTSAVKSDFTGDIYWGTGDHSFAAYYPYNLSVMPDPEEHGIAVPVSLPTTQTQIGATNSHVGNYDFMIATPLSEVPPGTAGNYASVDLTFNHLFALLELKIVSESNSKITDVEVIAPTGNVLSFESAKVDITQTPPAENAPYILTSMINPNRAVAVTITDGVTPTNDINTTPSIYIMMAPVDLTSMASIEIFIIKEDNYYQTIKPGHLFKRGVKYRVPIIEDTGESPTVLAGDANSYIINPLPTISSFAFPITQSNRYWSNAAYGNNPANVIGANDKWVAQVIWQDAQNVVLLNNFGVGGEGPNGLVNFKAAPFNKGNALIGIKRDSDGDGTPDEGAEFLWSWHIWVTDYNPNVPVVVTPGTYVYPVTGGHVHRYVDPFPDQYRIWGDGFFYGHRYIMDRNLGATSTGIPQYYSGSDAYGALYYQYGRKDPFPSNIPLYDQNSQQIINPIPTANAPVTMTESIYHPNHFYIMGANWCSQFDNATYIWNDPLTVHQAVEEESPIGEVKSIFDPCPPGWKLPRMNAMISFHFDPVTNTGSIINELVNNPNANPPFHWIYIQDNIMAQYPTTGVKNAADGNIVFLGTYGFIWSKTATDNINAQTFRFRSHWDNEQSIWKNPNVWWYEDLNRAYAIPVRCVKE